jgi:tetratricopeptide (TPR) repeat protein
MAATQKEILRRTIDALETSLRRYPENEKILHQLALAYAQTARFDARAVDIYKRASEFFPSDVKIQRALSIGYLISQSTDLMLDIKQIEDINSENLNRNVEKLTKMTREYPDSPYIHRALGDLHLLNGAERDSIHHYRCAMALGLTEIEPLCAPLRADARAPRSLRLRRRLLSRNSTSASARTRRPTRSSRTT